MFLWYMYTKRLDMRRIITNHDLGRATDQCLCGILKNDDLIHFQSKSNLFELLVHIQEEQFEGANQSVWEGIPFLSWYCRHCFSFWMTLVCRKKKYLIEPTIQAWTGQSDPNVHLTFSLLQCVSMAGNIHARIKHDKIINLWNLQCTANWQDI